MKSKNPKPSPKFQNNKEEKTIRLNKFLSNGGLYSRREADDFIKMGLVQINGKIITEMGSQVKPTD